MAGKRDVFLRLAQVGYVTKGLVYGLLGVLAANAAWFGGSASGKRGMVRWLASESYGRWILVALCLGMVAHGLWRLVDGIFDPKGRGSEWKALFTRGFLLMSSVTYFGLAYVSGKVAWTGGGAEGSDGGTKKAMTAELLSQPFGQVLVGVVAVFIFGVAVSKFIRAYKVPFMDDYNSEMTGQQRNWAKWTGRAGEAARGVVFAIVGWFFLQAAINRDPGQTGGLDQALAKVSAQPQGKFLLGIVAGGLIAYAVHSIVRARYTRFIQR